MYPKHVIIMVMSNGEILKNIKNPTILQLHDANLVIVLKDNVLGTCEVWKDRFDKKRDDLPLGEVEEYVDAFVKLMNEPF